MTSTVISRRESANKRPRPRQNQPRTERNKRNDNDGGNEDSANTVGQPLDRRSRGLRVSKQPDDATQSARSAERRCTSLQNPD